MQFLPFDYAGRILHAFGDIFRHTGSGISPFSMRSVVPCLVAGHNVDSKDVDSHNVEVIMSKSQNVDNGNGESQNVESVTHTRGSEHRAQ